MNNSEILSSSVSLQLKKDKTLQMISKKPEKKIWNYARVYKMTKSHTGTSHIKKG